ncbi:MAG: O-antigen ligase family protein [Planctomycetota bacterium]|jgi:O-antigen ligase
MSNRGVYGTYGYGAGYGYGYGRSKTFPRGRKSFFVLGVFLALLLSFYALVLLGHVDFSYRNFAILIGLTFAYALTLTDIRIGLVLMYFSFGFSPEFEIGGVPNIRIEDFLIPVILVAWLTKVANRRHKFEPLNVRNPILLLFFIMLMSSLFNIAFHDLEARRSLLFFVKETEYFIILLLVANNIRRRQEVRVFIILSLLICVSSAIYHYFMHKAGGGIRLGGPEGETSNVIGAYYLIHMLLAFGLLFSVQNWRDRILLITFLIVMTVPFMRTYSRTSFVALFGAMVFVGLLRNRRMLLIALLLFTLLPVLANQTIIVRFGTVASIFSNSPPSSWNARVDGWKRYLAKVKKAPILGHGIGSAHLVVDNEYIKVASELGFIGLGAFLWLLSRIGMTAFYTSGMVKDPVFKGFALGYFAILVGLMIHCIGSTSFTTIRSMMPFYFITGMLYVIYNRFTEAEMKVDYEFSKSRHVVLTEREKDRLVAEQIEKRIIPDYRAEPPSAT